MPFSWFSPCGPHITWKLREWQGCRLLANNWPLFAFSAWKWFDQWQNCTVRSFNLVSVRGNPSRPHLRNTMARFMLSFPCAPLGCLVDSRSIPPSLRDFQPALYTSSITFGYIPNPTSQPELPVVTSPAAVSASHLKKDEMGCPGNQLHNHSHSSSSRDIYFSPNSDWSYHFSDHRCVITHGSARRS